ncbi:MAG TPA: glycoside hydrolase 43 family protein [Verrucomicrobiae bacterium]|nr:glycoside hydrolase 43 family protein [Verrucomicrobiae bacterium]
MNLTTERSRPIADVAIHHPWFPDQGDGTYRNPVLCADYSDPDVVRRGDDFYLVASSFNCTPALPILHSRDLVNWTLIGHALKNLPHERYREVQHGCGIWAPAIRFHAEKFWVFFPTPDEGIFVVTAKDPRGPWSEPRLVQEGKGLIDPCPLWDDDGSAYLVHAYAGSRAGIKHMLRVRPMAPDASRLLGEGQIVFHAPERHPTVEGPKFLKKDGWYYILAPAGGVETGWQLALRSKAVYGPYEERVILETGSTGVNGPHQGALIDLPVGDWWFMHFQDAGVYGRIVHLQPVRWNDGWPLAGKDFDGNGVGEPVAVHAKPNVAHRGPRTAPETSDEFDAPRPGLQWQWHANHDDAWADLTVRPGWLRLIAQFSTDGNLLRLPNLLLQKFPAECFTADTVIELDAEDGTEAGLAIIGKTSAAIALRAMPGGTQFVFRVNDTDTILSANSPSRLHLRACVSSTGMTRFEYSEDGARFTPVPGSFAATKGYWIGAKIGLYCLRRNAGGQGFADADYFRFSPL